MGGELLVFDVFEGVEHAGAAGDGDGAGHRDSFEQLGELVARADFGEPFATAVPQVDRDALAGVEDDPVDLWPGVTPNPGPPDTKRVACFEPLGVDDDTPHARLGQRSERAHENDDREGRAPKSRCESSSTM